MFPTNFDGTRREVSSRVHRFWYGEGQTYGITGQRDTCLFIDVMVAFGRDFHCRLPWAAEILNSAAHASERVNALHASALERVVVNGTKA